jgi:hypothetical protein
MPTIFRHHLHVLRKGALARPQAIGHGAARAYDDQIRRAGLQAALATTKMDDLGRIEYCPNNRVAVIRSTTHITV